MAPTSAPPLHAKGAFRVLPGFLNHQTAGVGPQGFPRPPPPGRGKRRKTPLGKRATFPRRGPGGPPKSLLPGAPLWGGGPQRARGLFRPPRGAGEGPPRGGPRTPLGRPGPRPSRNFWFPKKGPGGPPTASVNPGGPPKGLFPPGGPRAQKADFPASLAAGILGPGGRGPPGGKGGKRDRGQRGKKTGKQGGERKIFFGERGANENKFSGGGVGE